MRRANKLHCLLLPLPQRMRKLLLLLAKNQCLPLPMFLLLQLFEQQLLLLLLQMMVVALTAFSAALAAVKTIKMILPLLLPLLLSVRGWLNHLSALCRSPKNCTSAIFLGKQWRNVAQYFSPMGRRTLTEQYLFLIHHHLTRNSRCSPKDSLASSSFTNYTAYTQETSLNPATDVTESNMN